MILTQKITLACLFIFLFNISCKQKDAKEKETASVSENSIQLIKFPKPSELPESEKNRFINEISAWYEASLANSNFNGGILVAKGGNILFEKYKGSEPLGSADSVTENTAFHIASTSKTFTAMAVLKLWEEKKLNIDDEYSKYFPGFDYPGVTVRTLLNHRSGLPNYLHFIDKLGFDKIKFISNQDVLDVLINRKAELTNIGTPDRHFSYNNTNYVLLALLIEKISGKSYPDFMSHNIFMPLGMKNSYVYNVNDSSRATLNYDWKGKVSPLTNLDGTYGDKNIYSTVRDLLIWDRALTYNLFLKKEILDEAYIPYSNETPGIKNYGLGWRMDIFDNGKKIIFHNGWWHGNNSVFIRLPEEDATIIVLNNRFSHSIYQSKILANVFGQYFTIPPKSDTLKMETTRDKAIPKNQKESEILGE